MSKTSSDKKLITITECQPSELNVFEPTPLQNGIIGSDEVEYQNINSLDNATVIEFNIINKSFDTYLDLSTATLFMQIQLIKSDGTTRYKEKDSAGATVDKRESQPSCINNMLSSIIKSATITMNGVVVSSCSLYAYKHYLDTVLNYGSDAAAGQLNISGFYRDDAGNLDKVDDTNSGTKLRRTILLDSSNVYMYAKLDIDVMNTQHLLINSVDLKCSLQLNDPSFYLLETGTSKLLIHKASILVRHCKINQNVVLQHNDILSKRPALYPFSRSNIRSVIIPTGISNITIDNLYSGVLPNSLIFAFVLNDAFNGIKSKNPLNFTPNDLQAFTVFINGIPLAGHPIETQKYGYTKYMQAYRSLFLNTQALYKDASSIIPYTCFRDGFFILPINLSPTLELTGGMCANPLRQGIIKVDLKFHDPIKNTLNMIVYSESSAMFSVDKNRNVEIIY